MESIDEKTQTERERHYEQFTPTISDVWVDEAPAAVDDVDEDEKGNRVKVGPLERG